MEKKEFALKLLKLILPWYVSRNLPSGLLTALFGSLMSPLEGWPLGPSYFDWWYPPPWPAMKASDLPPDALIEAGELPPDMMIDPGELPTATMVYVDAAYPYNYVLAGDMEPGTKVPASALAPGTRIHPDALSPDAMIPASALAPGTETPDGVIPRDIKYPRPVFPRPSSIPNEWLASPVVNAFGMPPWYQPGPNSYPASTNRAKRARIGWYSYTGSAFWSLPENLIFNEEGCTWTFIDSEDTLEVRGAWSAGFRPTHFRITHNLGYLCIEFLDSERDDFFSVGEYISETIQEIEWGELDLDAMFLCGSCGDTISKIEFYGLYQEPTSGEGTEC